MTEPLLTTREAARYLKLSRSTLGRLRREGAGPPFVRLSLRAIRYQESELNEWMKAGGYTVELPR